MDKFEIFLAWFDYIFVAWFKYIYEVAKNISAAIRTIRTGWPDLPTRPDFKKQAATGITNTATNNPANDTASVVESRDTGANN